MPPSSHAKPAAVPARRRDLIQARSVRGFRFTESIHKGLIPSHSHQLATINTSQEPSRRVTVLHLVASFEHYVSSGLQSNYRLPFVPYQRLHWLQASLIKAISEGPLKSNMGYHQVYGGDPCKPLFIFEELSRVYRNQPVHL